MTKRSLRSFVRGALVTAFLVISSISAQAEVCPAGKRENKPFRLMLASEHLRLEIEERNLPLSYSPPGIHVNTVVFGDPGAPFIAQVSGGNLRLLPFPKGSEPASSPIEIPDCDKAFCQLAAGDLDGDGIRDAIVLNQGKVKFSFFYGSNPLRPSEIGFPQTAVLVGVANLSTGRQIVLLFNDTRRFILQAPDRIDAGESTQILLDGPLAPNQIRLAEREGKTFLISSHPGVPGFAERNLEGNSTDFKISAEFWPVMLAWKENFAIADLDGNGEDDIIALAEPSRNFWAALAGKGGRFEVPVETSRPVSFTWRLVATGDLNGDGLEDLLLYDTARQTWLTGLSLAAAPLQDTSLVIQGKTIRTDTDGWVCDDIAEPRPGDVVSRGGEILVVSAERRKLPAAQVRLVRQVANGSIFSVGAKTSGPYVCIGYHPSGLWGHSNKWGARHDSCPEGYARYSADEPYSAEAAHNWVDSPCCPLPEDDILSPAAPTETLGLCPPGAIVVGQLPKKPYSPGTYRWLCRLVSSRYRLGPETGGMYTGHGFTVRGHTHRMRDDQIPPAIRESVKRSDYNFWFADGCIGNPPGSLLVGRIDDERGCGRQRFRQLLYAGNHPGDPPDGTPVKMFPECRRVDNPYSAAARCLPSKRGE